MLSSNNRTVAIPPTDFPDRVTCGQHLFQALAIARVRHPEPQQRESLTWIWVLTDPDGVEFARSYISYSRLVECRHAIRRFVDAVAE